MIVTTYVMDEVMQIVFEIKESLCDSDYIRIVEKISDVNPNKETTIEYPYDTRGINPVVTASPSEHIHNLKRKFKLLMEKYTKDTTKYLKIIADLSEDNIKLRKEVEEWDHDDDEDEI